MSTPAPMQLNSTLQRPEDLLIAASNGDTFGVRTMLSSRTIDVNIVDDENRNAAHFAASGGFTDVLKILSIAGCNFNQRDNFGFTPFDEALKANHQEAYVYIRQQTGGVSGNPRFFEKKFIQSAFDGDAVEVDRLFFSGVIENANAVDSNRRTALHHATAAGHQPVVTTLISHGANPLLEDKWGFTPLKDAERLAVRSGNDVIREELSQYVSENPKEQTYFPYIALFFEILCCIFYGIWVKIDYDTADPKSNPPTSAVVGVNFLQGMHGMVVIGLGLIFTFLYKHSFSSSGFALYIIAFAIQWHVLIDGFFTKGFDNNWSEMISLSSTSLANADYAAATCVISFGVLLGKASLTQLTILTWFEIVLFVVTRQIGQVLKISDTAGSMSVHLFGAYYGIGASLALTSAKQRSPRAGNNSSTTSEIHSMIGTLAIWCFFPSFNAVVQPTTNGQIRAFINTVIALTSSCISAFILSHFYRIERNFSMVDIQNASIAGGVLVATAAPMILYPVGSFLCGISAAIITVSGINFIQPVLERLFNLHDTAGVHNTHGMPGIAGGVASAIAAAAISTDNFGTSLAGIFPEMAIAGRTPSNQGGLQAAFFCICLGISLVGGALIGFVCRLSIFDSAVNFPFSDRNWWIVNKIDFPYIHDEKKTVDESPKFEEVPTPAAPPPVFDVEQAVQVFDQKSVPMIDRIQNLENLIQIQQMTIDSILRPQVTIPTSFPLLRPAPIAFDEFQGAQVMLS